MDMTRYVRCTRISSIFCIRRPKRKFSFFETVADVINLLMNDNEYIRYQQLSAIELWIVVPLIFVGLIFVNGILSAVRPQIDTMDDLYASPFYIYESDGDRAYKATRTLELVNEIGRQKLQWNFPLLGGLWLDCRCDCVCYWIHRKEMTVFSVFLKHSVASEYSWTHSFVYLNRSSAYLVAQNRFSGFQNFISFFHWKFGSLTTYAKLEIFVASFIRVQPSLYFYWQP